VLDVNGVVIKEGKDWVLAGFVLLAVHHLYWSQNSSAM
jgi:hypothetical protein